MIKNINCRNYKGTTDPPAVSIYGPNGVGFADDAFDNSPNCDSCVCGRRSCPDAGTNHPRAVPDRPKSFSVAKTWSKGQIRLKWKKSDSDGNSPITDYQYQYSYYRESSGGWTAWDDSWESAGMDMTELISGLRSKTTYRVRMRAVNDEGPSEITGWMPVTTR